MRYLIHFARFHKMLVRIMPKTLYNIIFKIYKKLLYVYYSGNNFICPCCGGHYRKFLSFGRFHKSNVRCPYDDSLERHRLLWIYLMNKTNFFKGNHRVLHFGPEDCFQNYFKTLSNLQYISADLDSYKAMIEIDITKIMYKANYFNYIICSHVLEHVLDDNKAMRELFRVLEPGGMVFVQCPINYKLEKTFEDRTITTPEDRERIFGQSDHIRIYGTDFKERLKKAGFQVKVEKYGYFLPNYIINKFVLNKNDEIFICTKLK